MKKLKKIAFKTVILYVIFFVIMSSIASTYAVQTTDPIADDGGGSSPSVRYFTDADRQHVADYARDFVNIYGQQNENRNIFYDATRGAVIKDGVLYSCCCTSGVALMFQNALNINIYELGFNLNSQQGYTKMKGLSANWTQITDPNDIKPGDIVMRTGHTELYIGNSQNANFGGNYLKDSRFQNCVKFSGGPRYLSGDDQFNYVFRLKSNQEVDLNAPQPSGELGEFSNPSSGIYNKYFTEGKFYFRGVPDGQYSVVTRKNIFEIIVDAIAQIANFIAGLMTYILRGVIISIISVFDRLLNTTYQSMENDPENDSVTLEESGMDSTEADLQDRDNTISIEGIIFNDIDLFDVDIFRTNSN